MQLYARPRCARFLIATAAVLLSGCDAVSRRGGPDGEGEAVQPGSETLLSTIQDTEYGQYELTARQTKESTGEWVFAVRSARVRPKEEFTFVWDFGDGGSYQGVEQTYTFAQAGKYTIIVEAKAPDGSVAFVLTLNIEVSIDANQPPSAQAGADQTVDENELVFLFAGGSTDPDGDPIEFNWVQTSGSPVQLLNTSEATASFVAPTVDADTDLTFTVRVTDGALVGEDSVVVHVINFIDPAATGPVADAGPDQNVAEGELVALDGSNSVDPDGTDLAYQWSRISGPSVTLTNSDQAVATFVAPAVVTASTADIVLELLVTSGGLSSTDEVRVTVQPGDSTDGTPTDDPCAKDSDGDGLGDCDDGCPNDPRKVAPGECGCGVPDADTDRDGTPNCLDGCPFDSQKVAPGACGCGVSEDDPSCARVCVTGTAAWQNAALPRQASSFELRFEATVNNAPMDGIIAVSEGPGAAFSDYAILVRFNPSGAIDLRNGDSYSADASVTYMAGTDYYFRLAVDVPSKRYTAYVTPEGGLERTLGSNYAFRTEQQGVAALDNWATWADAGGSHDTCDVAVSGSVLAADAGGDKTIASGGSAVLIGQASGGEPPYSYRWSPSTGLSSTTVAQPTASPAVTTTYTLSVTDVRSATASDSVVVTVQASPLSASAGADKVIVAGGSTTLDGGASGGVAPYRFSWLPAVALSDATIARPTARPAATTTYVLSVTDNVGAVSTDSVVVTVQSSSAGLTPIARWDTVPYQRISPGETLNCGVVAFSKFGIQQVAFTVIGQGYTGPSPVEVTEMTLNSQTNVWEYWFPLRASSFTSDGPITVEAVVYGKDGGIRTKNTDGGGVGLDALPLNVNPKGTLPQATAWVSVAGDDATGKVNDSTKPLLTVMAAIAAIRNWNASNGYGNNADGGIVYLNAGTHQSAKPPWQTGFGETLNPNEWVTVTAAPGLSRDRVLLTRQYSIQDVEKVRVKGLTLQGASVVGCDWDESPSPNHISNRMKVWVDNSALIGSGKDVWASHPVSSVPQTGYYTNSYVTSVSFAHPPVSGIQLSRGMTIEHIGNDAFQNVPLAINARIDDLAPGPADPATPCPDPPDGSTCWHADVVGDGGLSKGNVLIYNVRATKARYQGIWCNIKPEGQINGYAFVNVYIETVNPVSGDWCCRSGYMFAVDHLLFWHVSFVSNTPGDPNSHSLLFAHDGKATAMTNVSVVGSVFDAVYINPNPLLSLETSGWLDNHYVKWDPIGARYTTGPHLLDSYGVPTSSSPVVDRVRTLVVPIDANNRPRTNGGDVGAYER